MVGAHSYCEPGGRVEVGGVCLGAAGATAPGGQCVIKSAPPKLCAVEPTAAARLMFWTTNWCYPARRCTCNVHNALRLRHGAPPPPYTGDLMQVFDDFTREILEAQPDYVYSPVLLFENWLLRWPEVKRAAIRKSVLEDLIMPDKVKAMIKIEVAHEPLKRARLIQFYKNLATQALFAPEFAALQAAVSHHYCRRTLPGQVDVTIACGMNALALGQWMTESVRRGAVAFYERDGKNWDATMRHEHAAFRYRVYGLFDPLLAHFAAQCENVRGLATCRDGVVRYLMRATVKSGHNDTTLGNSIINAAIAYYACRALGLRASILVMGDDLVVALYDEATCEDLMREEAAMGIKPEARMFYDPEDVSFISGLFARCGEEYFFVPSPGRLLARLFWTTRKVARRLEVDYLNGVSRCLTPICATMPIVRVFVFAADSGGEACKTDKGYLFRGVEQFDADLRPWFERRYGLDPQQCRALEACLWQLPRAPLILKHPLLDAILERDLVDIGLRHACLSRTV